MKLLRVLQSVLAALFGVQSEQKYHDDFSKPEVAPYLVVGIILVAALVVTLALFVNYLAQ
ncbi:hypothetical protein PA25_29940 [Pseudoalteromonas sp. A25]|uniref:DUF2970 domain-containing protein n=1 Tax=Pseudoalteromonas sp. A25 TaxID=116092 RepID=UPI0012610760|nr:DUF2970 domain-containing protein [Pseudoalteromonas sp. A25]BBN83009.1 hypothetical protein PA25_29940 [Pseudoalteromonas sp. A25]